MRVRAGQVPAYLLPRPLSKELTLVQRILVRHGSARELGNHAPRATSAQALELLGPTLNKAAISGDEGRAFIIDYYQWLMCWGSQLACCRLISDVL